MWKQYAGPAKELKILPLEIEIENFTPYIGKFKTPSGEILDNSNLALLRWKYSNERDPETNWPKRQRAIAYRVSQEVEDFRGNKIIVPSETLYPLSELERVA